MKNSWVDKFLSGYLVLLIFLSIQNYYSPEEKFKRRLSGMNLKDPKVLYSLASDFYSGKNQPNNEPNHKKAFEWYQKASTLEAVRPSTS